MVRFSLRWIRFISTLAVLWYFSKELRSQPMRDTIGTSLRTFSTQFEHPEYSLRTIITPQFFQEVEALRAFIRDNRYATLKRMLTPEEAVNVLYLKALHLANYNCSRALALCLFSVLEHKMIQFRLPFFLAFSIPLTFEDDLLFYRRINNLPSHFYPDSHTYVDADRDKLQHFFASAYIAYTTETRTLVSILGTLTEWIEEHLIVGGSDDWRDKAVNEHGSAFGLALHVDRTVLPSAYLTLPLEARK
ncbi:MAG: hypothetical protein N3A63_10015 [Bacteroidetes bacterium]|nr:hypothetical protein [Bacteroidota bacterium]